MVLYNDTGAQEPENPPASAPPITLNPGDPLPAVLGTDVVGASIAIAGLSADLDITGWQPAGLVEGGIVSFIRTAPQDGNSIVFTDPRSHTYTYMDKPGDVLTLRNDNGELKII